MMAEMSAHRFSLDMKEALPRWVVWIWDGFVLFIGVVGSVGLAL